MTRDNKIWFIALALWLIGAFLLYRVAQIDFSNKTIDGLYDVLIEGAYGAYCFALIGLRVLVDRYFPYDPKLKGDGMGLFDFLKPKDDSRKMLVDLFTHNADMIQKSEGKDRNEAEYLAACLIIDDLSGRPNGREGYQQMMEILKTDYPQHLNDVITYVGWSTGKLHFKPDYDAFMRARHAR